MKTLEELELSLHKAEARQDCRNLIGKYQFYFAAYRMEDILGLFSKREDAVVEMQWGVYNGRKSIERLYLQDLYDRKDSRFKKEAGGRLLLHYADTEVLYVAEDLQTARGIWYSPGADSWEIDGKLTGQWSESRIGCDFIYEDGAWKIWKIRFFPTFKAISAKLSWTEVLEQNGHFDWIDVPVTPDAPPSTPPYLFGKDELFPTKAPDTPAPYNTYADLTYHFTEL